MRPRLLMMGAVLAVTAVQAEEGRFVQVCMSGAVAGNGTCPSQPSPGVQRDSWSCTQDRKTNLVWSIETGKGHWHYARGEYSAKANRQSRCGFATGWRLPSRSELVTILDRNEGALARVQTLLSKNGSGKAAIDARYFPATLPDVYWTADTLAADPGMALFVYFKPGFDNEGNAYADSKSEDNYIRLVHAPR